MFDYIADQETTTASKKGKKMPIKDVETNEVMTYQAKGDDAPKELYLMLLGPESFKMRTALLESANREKNRGAADERTEEQLDAEIAADARMLANLCVGGQLVAKGKWIEVTPALAEEAFLAVMSLRRQATQFALNLGNFRNK